MPKLWNDTVQEHRGAVRVAVLDTVARLVAEGGVSSVSMTKAAEGAGVSRATLYKYFPDVQALLSAWHERQVEEHLGHLHHVRAHAHPGTGPVHRPGHGHVGDPVATLQAVLEAYAVILQGASRTHAPAFLHVGTHADKAQDHLQGFLTDIISEATAGTSAGRDTDSKVDIGVGVGTSSDVATGSGSEVGAGAGPGGVVLGAASGAVMVRTDLPAEELALFALHAVNAAASARSPEAARLLAGVVVDGMLRHH